MGDDLELQTEELEVLKSIYDGDPCYTSQSDTRHQYKYGEDGSSRSFLLEISWPETYPSSLPTISLDSFYNKHLVPEVSKHIQSSVLTEADQYLGMSMTYSLFEFVKENFDSLISDQPESIEVVCDKVEQVEIKEDAVQTTGDKTKVKKSQLTKAQKRRMWDKGGAEEDRSRGWDWVDVIKHLHQTGGKEE